MPLITEPNTLITADAVTFDDIRRPFYSISFKTTSLVIVFPTTPVPSHPLSNYLVSDTKASRPGQGYEML